MINEIEMLSCEKLVYKIIQPYSKYFEIEDLYQVGMLALTKAYKNYSSNENTKFSSYAFLYIKGEIFEYIRKSNYFKVSKEVSKLNKKIEETRLLLTQKLNKEPSDKELARYLELEEQEILEIKERTAFIESLDASFKDDDNTYYNYQKYIEPNYQEDFLDLKFAIEELPINDQKLIYQRYINGATQQEISKELGISQVQVSRKEKEILTRLRVRLR